MCLRGKGQFPHLVEIWQNVSWFSVIKLLTAFSLWEISNKCSNFACNLKKFASEEYRLWDNLKLKMIYSVRSGILTVMTKILVFWNMTPCTLVYRYQHLWETYCLRFKKREMPTYSVLMYQYTRGHTDWNPRLFQTYSEIVTGRVTAKLKNMVTAEFDSAMRFSHISFLRAVVQCSLGVSS